jgi:hypothetical protein
MGKARGLEISSIYNQSDMAGLLPMYSPPVEMVPSETVPDLKSSKGHADGQAGSLQL